MPYVPGVKLDCFFEPHINASLLAVIFRTFRTAASILAGKY